MTIEALMAKVVSDSGMTMVAISEKTGIPYSKLNPSLKGRRELRIEEYLALCKLFDLDPLEFGMEAS